MIEPSRGPKFRPNFEPLRSVILGVGGVGLGGGPLLPHWLGISVPPPPRCLKPLSVENTIPGLRGGGSAPVDGIVVGVVVSEGLVDKEVALRHTQSLS